MSGAPITVRAVGRDWRCEWMGPATYAGRAPAGRSAPLARYRCTCVAEEPIEMIVPDHEDRAELGAELARAIGERRGGDQGVSR
jgi:hypothetical protein